MYQGLKLRIYPNLEQQKQIVENFGATRFVWNQMLEMQSKRYKNNKDSKFLNGFAMNFLLRQLKKEYSWLKQSESTSLQDTCETLAVAFQRFFKKLGGYPKFKSRKFPK
ncbi:MAG: helix-turn-helix domain-containing protein [Liquorilactobacillus sp.]